MNPLPSRSFVLASATAAVLAACGDSRDPIPAAAADRQPASEQVQQMTGLSHMPRPESVDALNRSLARHYPLELAGVRPRSLVLVDVQLDEQGRVRDVRPVDRPATAPSNASMVLVDEVPGNNTPVERAHQGTYDATFGPAARAALREVRFQPALRDGRPVPYTLRMTVEFTSPQQAS
jgi:hypothetical protein